MSSNRVPRWNPFYFLLIVVSFAFVVIAFAYAVIPVLEQKAVEVGNPPPPSAWREALRADGWKWLLGVGGAVCLLGLLSMGYDRLYRAIAGMKTPPVAPTSAPPSGPAPYAN